MVFYIKGHCWILGTLLGERIVDNEEDKDKTVSPSKFSCKISVGDYSSSPKF